MNTLLDWIFGFDAGTFGTDDSGIGLATSMPSWLWGVALLGLGTMVWLSYRRLSGPAWIRMVLGGIRWGIVVMLLVLALGPQIERRRVLVEPDRVIVLLDASGSMNMPEILNDGSMTTRGELLAEMLSDHAQVFESLKEDSTRRNSMLDVYTFTNQLTAVDGLPMIDPSVIRNTASTTLGSSIQSSLSKAGTSPVSGIVIFSDGQSHDEPSAALLQTLLGSGIPVIAIPIGSSSPILDASIRLIESPNAVFAKDRVPIRVSIGTDGYQTGDEMTIELFDDSTGQVLSTTTGIVDNERGFEVDLSHRFTEPGTKNLQIRVHADGPGVDLVDDNNEQPIELQVVAEPMRVLYIDGYPRWEYRYLKNILMRESTIKATTMLLAADRRFIEEGQPLSGPIPDSLEAWEPFDVVILGDVRPDLFSESQLNSLKEHIETRGCGLLWIAGEGSTPKAWSGSQLAPLLPIQSGKIDSVSTGTDHFEPVVASLTEQASRVGLLIGDGESKTSVDNPDAGWTILRWHHSIPLDDLKPGVGVLATAQSIDQNNTDVQHALVTAMRYGRGQVGYVGTDEIWRWRYGRGEDVPEQFWLPMIRSLGRGTIARRASPAAITITPTRPNPGKPVRLTLDIFDAAIIDDLPQEIEAVLSPLSSNLPESTTLLIGNGPRRSGIWTPNEPGIYQLRVSHPLIGPNPISQIIRVHAAWAESANPNTDHPSLIALSTQTGGQTLTADQLDQLPSILPNRTRTTTLPPQTTALWDRPIVLMALVLLLSIEWIGRRTLRLA